LYITGNHIASPQTAKLRREISLLAYSNPHQQVLAPAGIRTSSDASYLSNINAEAIQICKSACFYSAQRCSVQTCAH
jgi:hypothetical protein